MPTFDKTADIGRCVPVRGPAGVYVIQNDIDINAIAGAVAADVIRVLKIPAGSRILALGAIAKRAGVGTTATYTFGSAGGGTITGTMDGKTATGAHTADATLTDPKIKDTDTDCFITVTLTTLTAITDKGRFRFYAVLADLNAPIPAL